MWKNNKETDYTVRSYLGTNNCNFYGLFGGVRIFERPCVGFGKQYLLWFGLHGRLILLNLITNSSLNHNSESYFDQFVDACMVHNIRFELLTEPHPL